MKILITGGLGYIGCELLYRLKNTNIEVIVIDNSSDAILSRLGFFTRFDNIKFKKYDICDDLSIFTDVDIIIHLAAIVGYLICDQQPHETNRTNIDGVKNIAKLNKPTIFFSTGSVYGSIGDTCNETISPNPQTLYAETKLEGEKIIKMLSNYIIYRPATAYGLSFKVRHDLLIHTLCNDAVNNQHIKLYKPNVNRSFYSVHKLAELCEFSINNFDLLKNNTYNVGSINGNITKQELVDKIKQYIDVEIDLVKGEDRDKRNYNVDYSKLKNKWDAMDESLNIKKIINYYKNI